MIFISLRALYLLIIVNFCLSIFLLFIQLLLMKIILMNQVYLIFHIFCKNNKINDSELYKNK